MEAANSDKSWNGSETDSIEQFYLDESNHGRGANTTIAGELTKALRADKPAKEVEEHETGRVEEREQGVKLGEAGAKNQRFFVVLLTLSLSLSLSLCFFVENTLTNNKHVYKHFLQWSVVITSLSSIESVMREVRTHNLTYQQPSVCVCVSLSHFW